MGTLLWIVWLSLLPGTMLALIEILLLSALIKKPFLLTGERILGFMSLSFANWFVTVQPIISFVGRI
jgi:hypothetical protein